MSRHTLVLLALAAMLLLSAQFLIADAYNPTMLTSEDIVDEIAIKYGRSMDRPENYRAPFVDPSFKIITYAGTPCRMPASAREGTAPIVRYAWDFDSDGFIDWQSYHDDQPLYTFEYGGDYYATLYAWDIHGEQSMAVVPVEVRLGDGTPEITANDQELTFWGMDEKRRRQASALSDPAKRYFLLSTGSYASYMDVVRPIYDALVDTFGVHDSDIVLVMGFPSPDSIAHDMDDTLIIDYNNLDSGLNYVMARMTGNDDLHVWSDGHGSGMYDSSCVAYGGDQPFTLATYKHRVISNENQPGDPDLDCTEAEFKMAYLWDEGGDRHFKGMGEWAGYYNPTYDKYYRHKLLATFSGYNFFNDTAVHSDTDIYVEEIYQYLIGDTDHDNILDSCWDCDNDGNPPIAVDANTGALVYDDDDWGDYELDLNNDHDSPAIYPMADIGVAFDDQFDGKIDFEWVHPVLGTSGLTVDATDDNNDGVVTGIDVNEDGDLTDSVGVDEFFGSLAGVDDHIAAWLDSLDYRYVTFTVSFCFGGGLIDDLSRENVLIATGTTDGALSSSAITNYFWLELTGGSNYTPRDSVDVNGDTIISFREAYNVLPNNSGNFNYGCRLDDNGDGVGHAFPLPDPDSTDGYLADSINFGTLPYPAPIPTIVSPVDTADLEDDLWPHFEWSVDTTCDSFDVSWAQVSVDYPQANFGLPPDATCQLDTLTVPAADYIPHLPSTYAWVVRSYLGLSRSTWSDTGYFQLTVDYSCCNGIRGNVDGDTLDQVDITDLMVLQDFLYLSHSALDCYPEANVDGQFSSEVPDGDDYDALIDFLFYTLTPPDSCD